MFTRLKSSIALKVATVLALFLCFLTIDYGLLENKIQQVDASVSQIQSISNNAILVLEINNDIVELQRNVSVYGQSGNPAILEKMHATYSSIKLRLDSLIRQQIHPSLDAPLQEMRVLAEHYGDNLNMLQTLYEAKRALITHALPATFEQGESTLRLLIEKAANSGDRAIASLTLNAWYQMNRAANQFLTNRQFNQRRAVIRSIAEMRQSLAQFSPDFILRYENELQVLDALGDQYQLEFSQGVQANRNYLSLVNVVMAGDALEFTIQADTLRAYSLSLLEDIKAKGKQAVSVTQTLVQFSVLIGFTVFITLGLFFHFHITQAIKRLTQSFQAFRSGHLSAPIHDTERLDEIGLLAAAAQQFKAVSEDLLSAKKEAENTSKIKSEFLANMSHEIRTPMNGILGMVNILSKTELAKEQKDMLEIIDSSGKSLMVILNDILDFSKIDSGKITLEQARFDLFKMIIELNHLFKPLAKEKGITFKVPRLNDLSTQYFIGDVTRIKQVLINLLSNAVKFTETGEVCLSISQHEVDVDANTLMRLSFAVSDSGIGIEENHLATLFDAFSQADSSITRRFGGTGLGLSISNKLLSLMGAQLSVESSVGKGSCFAFDLTLVTAQSDRPLNQTRPTISLQQTSLRILIAEDNEINQMVIKAMLRNMHFNTITLAKNGLEAVQHCKTHQVDLIFMDMQMPVMDGLEATRQIRQLSGCRHIPIVALTANVLPEDSASCFKAGMSHFLPKPIEEQALSSLLQTLLVGSSRSA